MIGNQLQVTNTKNPLQVTNTKPINSTPKYYKLILTLTRKKLKTHII